MSSPSAIRSAARVAATSRPPRRDTGPRLMPRDRELLRWLGRHGIVTPEQVARAVFARDDGTVGTWAAYRRLRKLEQLGLIRRDPTFWREPFVLRLTEAGARVAGLGLSPAKLSLAEVHHSVMLVDLTESLLRENPTAKLTTEREIRAQRYREIRAGERRLGVGRTPDAVLTFPKKRTVAVELDLTTKRERVLRDVIANYVSEQYTAVWWYVLPGRSVRLQRLVDDEHAADFISMREWQPR